jgi:hypothetical protein
MRRGRCCLRSSSSGWRLADIGDVQGALNTLKTQAVVSDEGGGGDAFTGGGAQFTLGSVTSASCFSGVRIPFLPLRKVVAIHVVWADDVRPCR